MHCMLLKIGRGFCIVCVIQSGESGLNFLCVSISLANLLLVAFVLGIGPHSFEGERSFFGKEPKKLRIRSLRLRCSL